MWLLKCISNTDVCILYRLQAKFKDFKIQNMVGSCDVKFPIRLEGLVLTHGQFSRYRIIQVCESIYAVYRLMVLSCGNACL